MKKILAILVLAILSISNAFALSYTERLNAVFQTLADAGINPTILNASLEDIQPFGGSGSVDFTVTGRTPERWIGTIANNLVNSVYYQGDITLSTYSENSGMNQGVEFFDNGEIVGTFTVVQDPAVYYLQNNRQWYKTCYVVNSPSAKRCIKTGLNTLYSKVTGNTPGLYRKDSLLWTRSFGSDALSLISGGIEYIGDEIKIGMQNNAWLTAASILGETVSQICEPGVITPSCNIIGQKFEQFNTQVMNAPLDVLEYNKELDNIFLLVDVTGELDQIATEWYAGDNGELTFGHVNWGSITQP